MTNKINIADLPEFDITEHLDSEQAIAEYLTIVLEEDDPEALRDALGSIARARGMTDMCQTLTPEANAGIGTFIKAIHALGVSLVAQPRHAEPA